MDGKTVEQVIGEFGKKKVLVVGDVMLDKYVYGNVERMSPEAPIPIVAVKKEEFIIGGAANVAANCTAVGASVSLIGVVGDDKSGTRLKQLVKKKRIVPEMVVQTSIPTIEKSRVIGNSQQLVRIDYEKTHALSSSTQKKIVSQSKKMIDKVDVIILSDYNKGVFSERVASQIISYAVRKKKPVIVDPKPSNIEFFSGSTLITPNHKEACMMMKCEEDNGETLRELGKELVKEFGSHFIITRGEKGMSVFDMKGNIFDIPTKAKEVYDVTGAGDTVIAILALSLVSGASLQQSALIANHAAGISVEVLGNGTVSREQLLESFHESKD